MSVEILEITSDSKSSFRHAVEKGLERACETVDGIRSAWIEERRVVFDEGRTWLYRVTMKVTFALSA